MKNRSVFTAAALAALGLVSSFAADNTAAPAAPAPTAAAPAPMAPAAPAPAAGSEQILEAYGWFLGRDMEIYAFGLSDAEFAALARGMASAARGKNPPDNVEQIGPQIQHFLQTRPSEVAQRRLAEGRAEEEKLFAELDKKEGVKKTETGLRYEIVSPGNDKKPGPNDRVTANYTGAFVDGTIFDTTAKREPAEFGLNEVIAGWKQGLPLIGVGGKIKLYVPAKLGYGDSGRATIPPGKALIFDVELVSFRPEQPQLMPQGQPQLLNP